MRKIYIFDTSILIHDPNSLTNFPNSDVILPITVLDELDKLKKLPNDAGRNARVAIKLIDEISNKGEISTGIELDNNIFIKIDINNYEYQGDALYGDTRIVACAVATAKENPGEEVSLLSNDINLRVRARALGILAEGYNKDKVASSDLYEGVKYFNHPEAGEDLLQFEFIDPRCFNLELNPNEFVVILDDEGNEIALGRKVSNNKVKLVKKSYPWDLSSRNLEQILAIDLLCDVNVPFITLTGQAGCGKTLIALASSLEMVINKRRYDKLTIYRPMEPVGKDYGFLPGTDEEKLSPWFKAIEDNFEFLFQNSSGDKWRTTLEMYKKKERIKYEALLHIRGRSINNAIMLVDEVQNLSPEEIKTILTRAGQGTKIIFTGDISQIDNKSLDAMNNGLTHSVEKFKHSFLAGHITLNKSERSALAEEAAKIL